MTEMSADLLGGPLTILLPERLNELVVLHAWVGLAALAITASAMALAAASGLRRSTHQPVGMVPADRSGG